MNTTSIASYRFPQRLYPLNLLAQIKSRKMSGCLRVSSGTNIWSIYLEDGDLLYATTSHDTFARLDRHLNLISRQVPNLVSAVRVQLRLLFENLQTHQLELAPDYRAIGWLVEQQYLDAQQVATLIEALAKEVIEGFLLVNNGTYELIEKGRFEQWQNLARLNLASLVETCQQQLHRQKPQGFEAPNFKPLDEQRDRSLPTSARSAEATPTASTAKPANTVGSSEPMRLSKQHYTIVCIDDSPTVLRSISTFLDDSMFSVVMINDPVKALMQIVRSKPDLVLLDVTMPNLDGYELCSLLRKHPSFKNTPVVMVTGNTGFIDRAKAKLVGASGYLTKPFTQPDLLKVVFKHLK